MKAKKVVRSDVMQDCLYIHPLNLNQDLKPWSLITKAPSVMSGAPQQPSTADLHKTYAS